MRRFLLDVLTVALFALTCNTTVAAQFSLLHAFSGADGANPFGSIAVVGSSLYGVTSISSGLFGGTLFTLNSDGSGFQIIHEFEKTGTTGNGYRATGQLAIDGTTIYGTTFRGGSGDQGTIYSVNSDGTSFQHLRKFTGVGAERWPVAGVLLDGSELFGVMGVVAPAGIFKINTDGTEFGMLNSPGSPDGELFANPIRSGSVLYGTSSTGGEFGQASVYAINTDGTDYHVIHSLAAGPVFAGVVLEGSTLYGTTGDGGDFGFGVVYKVDVDGSGYEVLHSFAGGPDGESPQGGVVVVGSTIVGTTHRGGANGPGTVFQLKTDGTGFQIVHDFDGSVDGANPRNVLTVSGQTVYGMTESGGPFGKGVVFAVTVPEPGSFVLVALASILLMPWVWRALARRPVRTQ